LPIHRVVLTRSWTPAVLKGITNRIDPHGDLSVVVESGKGKYGHKGWWFVWSAPAEESEEDALRSAWTTDTVSRFYQARREPSAPKLRGITTRADWAHVGLRYGNWELRAAVRTYAETSPAALRARLARRAPKLGLRIRSFRVPGLDGVLAPVVTLQVSDLARFKRWYAPGCTEGWMFGPRADTNGSPYFGFFLTVDDSAGNWLGSMAATPNGAQTEVSPEMHKLFPPHVAPGQIGGMSACPKRFARP
jgi:hypothetical protein